MTLIQKALLLLFLAITIDSNLAWKKLNREAEGGETTADEITENQNEEAPAAKLELRTTEKVKREIDDGADGRKAGSKKRKQIGRVVNIDLDAPDSVDTASFSKSAGKKHKHARSKLSRIAASIDAENSDDVKGKGIGIPQNSIVARKRKHEDSWGHVLGRSGQFRDQSYSFTLGETSPGSPPTGANQSPPGSGQPQLFQQGGNSQQLNSNGPQFIPATGSASGVGVASYKMENDQKQIQESGTKNLQETIPMPGGGPVGQRQEQSAFQKQISSQVSRSESLIPVAVSVLQGAGFAQLPNMPLMPAMPQMAPMQGLPPMAPMPQMLGMAPFRLKRSISIWDSAKAHHGSGVYSEALADIDRNRAVEGKERSLANEEPANHNHGAISMAGNKHSKSYVGDFKLHTVTGSEVDDAYTN